MSIVPAGIPVTITLADGKTWTVVTTATVNLSFSYDPPSVISTGGYRFLVMPLGEGAA